MKEQITRSQKIARNRLDKRINAVVCTKCSGLQINIMDIRKVFAAGYEAAASGEDVEAAVEAEYRRLALNVTSDEMTYVVEGGGNA